jgi:gliding motility-associated-like protein
MWLTNPVQSLSTAIGLTGGVTYSCIITDANGCTVIGSASIGNIPGPVANFTPNPQTVDILDANIHFLDQSTNATTWLWSFGDGPPPSTSQNPSHTYQNEGTYLVTLIVTNGHGCIDSISETVLVEGYSTFYIPNTFTPNGDGRNDFFGPEFSRIESSGFSMMIFDRWGNKIFNSTTLGDFWDGRVNGSGPIEVDDNDNRITHNGGYQMVNYLYAATVSVIILLAVLLRGKGLYQSEAMNLVFSSTEELPESRWK